VKFLIDAQLPVALAETLRCMGHEAKAVREVGLRDAEDESIWQFAKAQQLTIITKDEDFAERSIRNLDGPAVIWLRVGNCSNLTLLKWLIPLLPGIMARLDLGDRLVEVI
jgi:predicted nuclease of predicted toxin-antitoxin system